MLIWILINAIGFANAVDPDWDSIDLTEFLKEFDSEPEGVLKDKPVQSRAPNVDLRIRPILPRFELPPAPHAPTKRPKPKNHEEIIEEVFMKMPMTCFEVSELYVEASRMFADEGLGEMTRDAFVTVLNHLSAKQRRQTLSNGKTGPIRISRCFLQSQKVLQEALDAAPPCSASKKYSKEHEALANDVLVKMKKFNLQKRFAVFRKLESELGLPEMKRGSFMERATLVNKREGVAVIRRPCRAKVGEEAEKILNFHLQKNPNISLDDLYRALLLSNLDLIPPREAVLRWSRYRRRFLRAQTHSGMATNSESQEHGSVKRRKKAADSNYPRESGSPVSPPSLADHNRDVDSRTNIAPNMSSDIDNSPAVGKVNFDCIEDDCGYEETGPGSSVSQDFHFLDDCSDLDF